MPHFDEQYLIYTRRSTDDPDNQKNSIEYQTEQCQRYARDHHLPIADLTSPFFAEHGLIKERHTAFKTSEIVIERNGKVSYGIERPKFQQLVILLAQQKAHGVIALCWDRISRNPHDDAIIKDLVARGIDVLFVQATYDKTSAGALHMDVDGMFAAHHSRVTSEKVRGTYGKLRAEGKCTYHSPVGYIDGGSDHKYFDPERAPLVKQLFELYATDSWSLQQLTIWSKQHGLTSKPRRQYRSREQILEGIDNPHQPSSRPISRSGMATILGNPFYIGYLRHHGKWLPGSHQPLVEKELFYRVQHILKQRTTGVHYEHKPFFLYRGFIRCQCGRRYAPYEQKGHAYYRAFCTRGCGNTERNIREEEIDELVARAFGMLCLTDKEAEALQGKAPVAWQRWEKEQRSRREALTARRTRIGRDLAYLADNKTTLLREGVYTMEAFVQETVRLTAERDDVEQQLQTQQEVPPGEMVYTVMNVLELARLAQDSYSLATPEQKHLLLISAFLELVIINRNIAEIRSKEGIDTLINRGSVLSGGPNHLILELPKLYQAALLARPILEATACVAP